MAAFLNLAWRRRNAKESSASAASPPGVMSVPSTDTNGSESPVDLDDRTSSWDNDDDGGVDEVASSNESFQTAILFSPLHKKSSTVASTAATTTTASTTPPRTPEGLRPRRSLNALRAELNLPVGVTALPLPPFYHHSSLPPFAALQSLPSTISATTTNTANVMSPPVTTSSFYSSTPSTQVAESPNLSIGHARTAVGALVAAASSTLPTTTTTTTAVGGDGFAPHHHSNNNDHDRYATANTTMMSVLPPRTWIKEMEEEEESSDDDDEKDTTNDFLSYQPLNDSKEQLLTPSRARQAFMTGDSISVESADQSSIHASPSSTWKHYYEQEEQHESYHRQSRQQLVPDHHHDYHQQQHDLSFSSRLGLVDAQQQQQRQHAYNFQPISHEVQEFVVSSEDHLANVSGISHSTIGLQQPYDHHRRPHENENNHAVVLQDSREDYAEEQVQHYDYYASHFQEEGMDSAMIRKKSTGQRARSKEQLVLKLVQHLQEQGEIVRDVQATMQEEEGQKLQSLEGLLEGYSVDKRHILTNNIQKIMNELDTAQQEEFFMSPTQIPVIAETHTDLRKALGFVQLILQTAITDKEREMDFATGGQAAHARMGSSAWLRKSLGVTAHTTSQSSQRTPRGGDTSLFSLPTDETIATPHTSNLSITSTITSRPISPYRPPSPNKQEALKLRQTLNTAAATLQKMALACDKLMKITAQHSMKATEEIKKSYLQLMSLSTPEVESLTIAFVAVPDMRAAPATSGLARIVSTDEADNINNNSNSMGQQQQKHNGGGDDTRLPVLPPRMPRFSGGTLQQQPPMMMQEPIIATPMVERQVTRTTANLEISSSDMFSPTTADMNSDIATVEFTEQNYHYNGDDDNDEQDDLRRADGSFDSGYDREERDDCERDAPPVDESSCGSEVRSFEMNVGAFPSQSNHKAIFTTK